MVRKLLKSTVAGKPSFLTAGLRCRRSRLRRSVAPPRLSAKTRAGYQENLTGHGIALLIMPARTNRVAWMLQRAS